MFFDNVYGSQWPAGAIVEMFCVRYRIVVNYGTYGEVERLSDGVVFYRWFWECLDERAVLVLNPV